MPDRKGSGETMLPDSLVTTEWLAAQLDAPPLRVIDIRGYVRTTDLGEGRQRAEYAGAGDEYDAGHIPGASFIDWTADIVDLDQPVTAQIAPPARFAAAMRARGVGDETAVVVVDHSGGHFATRLWWALRYYGHDRAAVLDGGYAKWVAEGRPMTTKRPIFSAGDFTPRVRPELRLEAAEVLERSTRGEGVILDARDEGQYRGDVRRGRRGGHVPGAVHLPAKSLVNEDGTWKPLDEQRTLFEQAGVSAESPVVAYCNGGVTATALLFAMHRLGMNRFANYDGSWNEWGEREELPALLGSAPR